jgi:hypothetical protein
LKREEIKVLSKSEVDMVKWDACVTNSANPLPYALSWYLNIVCENWVGLVYKDYLAVMPIPYEQKLGIKFIRQPLFTQQLGLFGAEKYYALLPDFLQITKGHFKLCAHYTLHHQISEKSSNGTDLLDLNKPYETLYKNYRRDRKARLRQIKSQKLEVVKSNSIEPLWRMFEETAMAKIDGGIHPNAFIILKELFEAVEGQLKSELWYSKDFNSQNFRAGIWMVGFQDKWIYLFNASSSKNRKDQDRTLLIDQFIESQAESNTILDFESPNVSAIRDFYQSFGAYPVSLQTLEYNNLPWIINYFWKLKKILR